MLNDCRAFCTLGDFDLWVTDGLLCLGMISCASIEPFSFLSETPNVKNTFIKIIFCFYTHSVQQQSSVVVSSSREIMRIYTMGKRNRKER